MSRDEDCCALADLDNADFAFTLPAGSIAQHPPTQHDGGRLMRLDRRIRDIKHRHVRQISGLHYDVDLRVVHASREETSRGVWMRATRLSQSCWRPSTRGSGSGRSRR